MITICTNNEHNRSHLISAIIDAGQTEAQAELLCETDEEDIWIDIFMSVDMSPFGSYNVSRLEWREVLPTRFPSRYPPQ
jgi:hypothetical protein